MTAEYKITVDPQSFSNQKNQHVIIWPFVPANVLVEAHFITITCCLFTCIHPERPISTLNG